MAFDSAEELPRRGSYGVWSMDHLETGIFGESKRVPGAHRSNFDASINRIRNNPHLVGSWLIIFVFIATAGAALCQAIWGVW